MADQPWTNLGYLLQAGLVGLSASEQAVYLRLAWLAGLRTGSCRCGVDRLVAWTGLSRGTVLAALRRLKERGLIRPYTREPKRPTAWLVTVPSPTLPDLPQPLRAEARADQQWLVDRLSAEDLELAYGILEALPEQEREQLAARAAATWGDLDPAAQQKAILELVVRASFGPGRLARYGV